MWRAAQHLVLTGCLLVRLFQEVQCDHDTPRCLLDIDASIFLDTRPSPDWTYDYSNRLPQVAVLLGILERVLTVFCSIADHTIELQNHKPENL